ncbi:MAG: hypothetical protein NT013_03105 [Planctomycetia bacterium]|nr:hypothetical protein [Planctomycetia bacterium]
MNEALANGTIYEGEIKGTNHTSQAVVFDTTSASLRLPFVSIDDNLLSCTFEDLVIALDFIRENARRNQFDFCVCCGIVLTLFERLQPIVVTNNGFFDVTSAVKLWYHQP